MEQEDEKYNPFKRMNKGSEIQKLEPHPFSKIKKAVAVISGKGGVGKSMVTSLLAVQLMNQGLKVGIIDADITGPSIAKTFGKNDYRAMGDDTSIIPAQTERGLSLIGANNLLDDPTAPIIWRGSLISNLVTTLYTNTIFDELDVLLIDMPPGTGDVPLTVFQSLPIDAAVVVSSPQDLVSEVVKKSVTMASSMNIKTLGVVMNMAYINCPDCGKKIRLFGDSNYEEKAKGMGSSLLSELPLDPSLTALVDSGKLEEYKGDYLIEVVNEIQKL